MTELKPESNFKDELQDDEILKEEVEEIIEEVKDSNLIKKVKDKIEEVQDKLD